MKFSISRFFPGGRGTPAEIETALLAAATWQLALVAACVTVEDLRLQFLSREDADGARLFERAVVKLKSDLKAICQELADLQALDGPSAPFPENDLKARVDALASDADGKTLINSLVGILIAEATAEVHLQDFAAALEQEMQEIAKLRAAATDLERDIRARLDRRQNLSGAEISELNVDIARYAGLSERAQAALVNHLAQIEEKHMSLKTAADELEGKFATFFNDIWPWGSKQLKIEADDAG
jgi:hypothetical protein